MSDWKAKRFWKKVDVVGCDVGFTVELDGRSIKTPAKAALILPTLGMAQLIADEWQAQDDKIDPSTMPATRTANAAIDKVSVQHQEVADMLAAYGDSDLLCYRADAPEALVARQAAEWDPMLDWAREALGVRLLPRVGIIHKPQEHQCLSVLSEHTHNLSPFELAAFHDLVSLSGSLILGFAAAHSARPAEQLWQISRLDEIWQAEQWGYDDDAESLAEVKKQSFLHAKRMFDLAATPSG